MLCNYNRSYRNYYLFKNIIQINPYIYREYSLPPRKIGKTLKSAVRKKTVYYRCRNNC